MRRVYVNIGSNLGDRMAYISRAVTLISQLAESGSMLVSEPFESEPWGFESANSFINVGVSFLSASTPVELLKELLHIQATISPLSHRTEAGGYADRLIDIDLIAIEGVRMDTQELTLPHPRAQLRDFVMKPLIETLPHIN